MAFNESPAPFADLERDPDTGGLAIEEGDGSGRWTVPSLADATHALQGDLLTRSGDEAGARAAYERAGVSFDEVEPPAGHEVEPGIAALNEAAPDLGEQLEAEAQDEQLG